MEGVFVRRGNVAEFVTIKLGISGDKFFEVLSGLKPGDEVVTGPYNSVRTIADGDEVRVDEVKKAEPPPSRATHAREQAVRIRRHRARCDLGARSSGRS